MECFFFASKFNEDSMGLKSHSLFKDYHVLHGIDHNKELSNLVCLMCLIQNCSKNKIKIIKVKFSAEESNESHWFQNIYMK